MLAHSLSESNTPRLVWRLLFLTLPLALTTLVGALDPDMAAFLGLAMSGGLAALSPIYAFPMILYGVALNNLTFIAGVHFGWMIIAGGTLGSLVHILLRREGVKFSILFLVMVISFMLLEINGGLLRGSVRLDRLFALAFLLVYLGLLTSMNLFHLLYGVFGDDPRKAFVYMVACVGVAVVASILTMLSSQEFSMARSGELGLSIGDTESSPRSLSNILGVVVVTSVMSAASLSAKPLDKMIWVSVAFASFMGMVYTGSRMPVASVGFGITLGLIAHVAFSGRSSRPINSLWFLIFLGFVYLLTESLLSMGPEVLPFIGSHVSELRLLRPPDIGSNVRFEMWGAYLAEVNYLKLIFGSGIGELGNPHSLYIGTLGAFGLIGLSLLSAFIVYFLIKAISNRSAVAVSIIAYTVLVLASSSDVDKSYFWVMMTIAIIFLRIDAEAMLTDPESQPLSRGVA
ncbi:hypothetical protein BEI_2151 [Halomonas beimenensis]|uniref:Uncharacterized protein n=2 Tax=Halomonas beimenensis TaxID=475662 RepID=A0A291P8E9_9GAMM|nr:hypothetical protein BEI_2151 [Halomonas beimenensis]